MRAFFAGATLLALATPASAAFDASLQPGLDEPFTFDFRSGGMITGNTATFTSTGGGRAVDLTASNFIFGDDINQTSDGIGVGGFNPDEVSGASEVLTLYFDRPFQLRSISFSSAGSEGVFKSDTTINLIIDGEFEAFFGDNANADLNADDQGRTTLLFASLDAFGGSVESITFKSDVGSSYAVTGISEVPLPAAAWMFLGGLAGIGGYLRYGRRAAAA